LAKTRQILLVKLLLSDEDEDEEQRFSILNSVPLGSYSQVIDSLSTFNTAPDGSRLPDAFGLLHGPGFLLQMPMAGPQDPVSQIAVSIHEDEIAWPVLTRICRRLGWLMMDPASGRTFGG